MIIPVVKEMVGYRICVGYVETDTVFWSLSRVLVMNISGSCNVSIASTSATHHNTPPITDIFWHVVHVRGRNIRRSVSSRRWLCTRSAGNKYADLLAMRQRTLFWHYLAITTNWVGGRGLYFFLLRSLRSGMVRACALCPSVAPRNNATLRFCCIRLFWRFGPWRDGRGLIHILENDIIDT